jgi:predicted Zn-dependent protease
VARAFAAGEGRELGLEPQASRVGALPAARAQAEAQGRFVAMTWVAHLQSVYRLTGVADVSQRDRFATAFADAVASFEPLPAADRARIRELRLRVARARAGERLEQLVERTGGRWSVEETAIANGLEPGTPLRAGQPVKVPVEEAYSGARPGAATSRRTRRPSS